MQRKHTDGALRSKQKYIFKARDLHVGQKREKGGEDGRPGNVISH